MVFKVNHFAYITKNSQRKAFAGVGTCQNHVSCFLVRKYFEAVRGKKIVENIVCFFIQQKMKNKTFLREKYLVDVLRKRLMEKDFINKATFFCQNKLYTKIYPSQEIG